MHFLLICDLFRRRITQLSSHSLSTHSGFDRGCGLLGCQKWGLVILLPGLGDSTDLLNTALLLQQSIRTAALEWLSDELLRISISMKQSLFWHVYKHVVNDIKMSLGVKCLLRKKQRDAFPLKQKLSNNKKKLT